MRAAVAIATVLLAGCLPDGHWKQRGPTTPEDLGDGWEIATPESVGLDPEVLAGIHDDLVREDRHFGTLGFLVVKDRKLVFETYLQSIADRDRRHHLQSVTKTVTSLAVGIAHDEGTLPDLAAPIADFLPAEAFTGADPRTRAITLEHLLTMRSGLAFANDVYFIEMLVDKPADPLRHILHKSMYAAPGDVFRYRDADPMLLSYVLQAATGRTEADFTRERLLIPLGITDASWDPLPDGATMGGVGLHLRPRDLAKIGQFLADCVRGRTSLPSRTWCEAAITQRIAPDDARAPDAPVRDIRRGYGYLIWTLPDLGAFSAWGHGGNFALVVPDHELVLVQIAMPDTDYLHGGWLEDFAELTAPLWTVR